MITGSVMMTQAEARERITAIQAELASAEKHYTQAGRHYDAARQMIYDLHRFEGWKALLYPSWSACIKAEFERGRSTIYRQLAAAAVEGNVSPNSQIGGLSERVLRPLTKKKFSADVQRTLYEIAVQISGSQNNVTSGTMNAVVDALGEAIVTGTFQDEEGEQYPILEGLKADVLARMVESRKRHIEYLQPKNSTKIISAMPVILNVVGQKNVGFTLTDAITPEQYETLLNGENRLKITVWVDEG